MSLPLLMRSTTRISLRAAGMSPILARRHIWKPTLPSGASATASAGPRDAAADRREAVAFVEARGYSPAVAHAVVDQLAGPEWGASGAGGVLALATRLAGAWEIGEDAGLKALAVAVERELAITEGRQIVTFHVQPARGAPFTCEAFEGMSIKDAAENGEDQGSALLGELLECACSGVMACSTCHVHVDTDWMEAVGLPSEDEEDMLDLAFDRRDTSRLGCQLLLRPDLNGLRISLPSSANNLFDHIPFQDDGTPTGRTQ